MVIGPVAVGSAPRDAAVSEIEGGFCQVEERVIATALGSDDRRRQPANAAHQTRRNDRMARGIGARRAQNIIVASDQAHFDIGKWICRGERPREDMQTVFRL